MFLSHFQFLNILNRQNLNFGHSMYVCLCSVDSFYRFVLEPELVLAADGITGPVAKFSDIPEAPLLTLNMITPEGWLVETVYSNCDLDNIHLKDVSGCVRFCPERGAGCKLLPAPVIVAREGSCWGCSQNFLPYDSRSRASLSFDF